MTIYYHILSNTCINLMIELTCTLYYITNNNKFIRTGELMSKQIIMYGADWCGDCIRAERFLDRYGISYQKINIDQDENAKNFVIKTNNGKQIIPTIIFHDNSVLVEPSNKQLADKLNIIQ
tara:strand:+ start:1437 stop:1799 length:363 start_codon:yes stop_codon:yes gene_type:complete